MKLRGYQTSAAAEVVAAFQGGARRVVLQLPTGAGKTHVAAALVGASASPRILYTVPSREVFFQTREKLTRAGVSFVELAAGNNPILPDAGCVLAMAQTLQRRLKDGKLRGWCPDLAIIDEAHIHYDHQRLLFDAWPSCAAVGLTATPVRLDGRPLAALYPVLVAGPSIKRLQEKGHLVPALTREALCPDLSGVRVRRGDFVQAELEERYMSGEVLDRIVESWERWAKGRPTITFAPGVRVSAMLVERFKHRGVRAAHLDAASSSAEREMALQRLRSGDIRVLCNVGLFVLGLDCVEASCIQLATATASLSRYLQSCGRGLRPAPGKKDLVVIDHGGNVYRHGPVDAPRDWEGSGVPLVGMLKACLRCHAVVSVSKDVCPACHRRSSGIDPPSQLRRSRRSTRKSRVTPARKCPGWAVSAAADWAVVEQERVEMELPLSYTASRVRRLLKGREWKSRT